MGWADVDGLAALEPTSDGGIANMTTTQNPPTALAIIDPRHVPMAVSVFGEERLALLAEQVGRGWKVPPTPVELEVIALICHQNRLDVFKKPPEIYFIKRWDTNAGKEVMTPQVSVDGLRTIAARSREYIGPGGQQWCGPDGVWRDVWLSDEPPAAARVGVLKRGSREPMWAVAIWSEWAQWQDETVWDEHQRKRVKTGSRSLSPFWRDKPAHMLAKVAESMILKRAFPAETNDLEIASLEEIHRLEAPALAAEYMRIHAAEEYGLPAHQAYVPPREREDVEDLQRQQTDQAAAAADTTATSSAAFARVAEQPTRSADADSPPGPAERGPRTYGQVFGDEQLEPPTEAEKSAPRDLETGEVLDSPVVPATPKIAGWQRNRELCAEAAKRKLTGVPTLNTRSSLDVVEAANVELERRIRDFDLDQRLVAEQEGHF